MSKIIKLNERENEKSKEKEEVVENIKSDIEDFLAFVEKKFDDSLFSTIFTMGFSCGLAFLMEDDIDKLQKTINELKEDIGKDIEVINNTIDNLTNETDYDTDNSLI